MPEFVTLSCPTCGASLQITEAIERFACAYCGNEHVVRRGGGIVTLAPVIEGLNRIQVGTDKTAAELAIRRLNSDAELLLDQVSTLILQATHADANELLNVLRKSRPDLFWKFRSSYGGQDLCIKLLDTLSSAELLAFTSVYENDARTKKRTKGKMVVVLRRIAGLKGKLHKKQNQLEEQLRIVDDL